MKIRAVVSLVLLLVAASFSAGQSPDTQRQLLQLLERQQLIQSEQMRQQSELIRHVLRDPSGRQTGWAGSPWGPSIRGPLGAGETGSDLGDLTTLLNSFDDSDRLPDNTEGSISPLDVRNSFWETVLTGANADQYQIRTFARDAAATRTIKRFTASDGATRLSELRTHLGAISDDTVTVIPPGDFDWTTSEEFTALTADDVSLVFSNPLPQLATGGFPKIHGTIDGGSRTKQPAVHPIWLTPDMFGIVGHPTRQAAHDASDDQTAKFNTMFAWATYYGCNVFVPQGYYRVTGTVFVSRENTPGRVHWIDGHYDEAGNTAAFRGHLLMEGLLCAPYTTSNFKPIFKTDVSFQNMSIVRVLRLLSAGDTGVVGWDSQTEWPSTLAETDTGSGGDTVWEVVENQVANHVSGDNTALDVGILVDGQQHGQLKTQAFGVCYGVLFLADGTRAKNIAWSRFGMVGDNPLNKWGYCIHGRTASNNNRFQTITLDDATSGTWTITHGANTTSALDWDDTPADIDAALTALASITSANVYELKTAGQQYDRTFKIEIQAGTPAAFTVNDASLDGTATVSYSNDAGWANANRFELGRGEASSSAPTTNEFFVGVGMTADPTLSGSQAGAQYFHHGNTFVGGDMCTDDTGSRFPVLWYINSGRENEWDDAWLEQGLKGLYAAKPAGYANLAGLQVQDNVLRSQLTAAGEISGNEIRWNGFPNSFIPTTKTYDSRNVDIVWDASRMCEGLIPSGATRWVWRSPPRFGMFYLTSSHGAEWEHDGSVVQYVDIPVEVDTGTDVMTTLDTLGGTAGSNAVNHGLIDGDRVRVTGGVGGVSTTQEYYVYNSGAQTIQLVPSRGSGSPENFTSGGTNPTIRSGRCVVGPHRRYLQSNVALSAGNSTDSYPGVEIEIDDPGPDTRIEVTRIGAASDLVGGQEYKLGRMMIAGWQKDGSNLDPGSFSVARWDGTPAVPNFGTVNDTRDGIEYQRDGADATSGRTTVLIPHYDESTPANSAHRLRILFVGGTKGFTLAGFKIRIIGNDSARVVVPNSHYAGTIHHRPQAGLHHSSSTYVDSGTAGTTVALVQDQPSYAVSEQYTNGHYYFAGQQVYTGATNDATIWLCTYPGDTSGATPDVDTGTTTADEGVNRWIKVKDGGGQVATWGP